VRFFAFLTLWITYKSLEVGVLGGNKKLITIWPAPSFINLVDPPDMTSAIWSEKIAAVILYLLLLAVLVLIVSYIISFYFSANTIIYALLRKRVDNTALEDIYTVSQDMGTEQFSSEFEPQEEPDTEPESETESDESSSEEQ